MIRENGRKREVRRDILEPDGQESFHFPSFSFLITSIAIIIMQCNTHSSKHGFVIKFLNRIIKSDLNFIYLTTKTEYLN